MFSSNWLMPSAGSQAAQNEMNCDVFIFSDTTLRAHKYKQFSLGTKSYFLVKHRLGQIQLYCIDKGSNLSLREVEVDREFTCKLTAIDADLVAKITGFVDPATMSNAVLKLNTELPAKKLKKLISLFTSYEKVNLKIWVGKTSHQKKLAMITSDTYILILENEKDYSLHYYLADQKINIPLLNNRQQDNTYDIIQGSYKFDVDQKIFKDVCITPAELKNFAKLMQNDARRGRLLQQLRFSHVPKPALNVYQQTRQVVANIAIQMKILSEKMLDQDAYQKYMVQAPKDAVGRYIISASQQDKMMVNYQRLSNLMINLQDFLEKSSAAHILILKNDSTFEVVMSVPGLITAYSPWIKSYSELYDELTPLGVIPFIVKMTSSGGLQDALSKLLPINQATLQNQLEINPFYVSYTSNNRNWQNILQGTDARLVALQKILKDFDSKLPVGGEASKTIQKTITDIDIVLTAVTRFSNSPRHIKDMFRLFYALYTKFSPLLKSLPKSLVTLNSEFKDHFLATAQQMNLIFQEITVNLDALEIQYRLKQHSLVKCTFTEMMQLGNDMTPALSTMLSDLPSNLVAMGGVFKNNIAMIMHQLKDMFHDLLTQHNLEKLSLKSNDSLYSLMEIFNATILEAGYEFIPQERFPYNVAILANREALLENNVDHNSVLVGRIEQLRTAMGQQDSRAEAAHLHQFADKYRLDSSLAAISERIIKLRKNKNYWFASLTDCDAKIDLLTKLMQKLPAANSIHAALNAMGSEDRAVLVTAHLLWTGRTGEMLKKLVYSNQISNKQMFEAIDVEIDTLMKERVRLQGAYIVSRQRSVEENILALQKFKRMLQKPGFVLLNALNELNATFPKDYQVLLSCQKPLLHDLRNFDHYRIKDQSHRIPIDFLHPQPAGLGLTEHQITLKYGYALRQIEERINELENEITFRFADSTTKAKKILMLQELQRKLTSHAHLDKVLGDIAAEPAFKKSYYLLREGRTGAMLNRIEYSLTTRDDDIAYLNVQIQRLQSLRAKSYSYFDKQEPLLEQRIYVLLQLKGQLETHPTYLVADAVNALEPAASALLDQFEKSVLTNLVVRQQTRASLIEYQREVPDEAPATEVIINPAGALTAVAESDSKPVSDEEFYSSIITNLANSQAQVDQLFNTIIDASIHAEYFEQVATDNLGRFDLEADANEPHWIHQYKRSHNLLVNARMLVVRLFELHVPLMEDYKKGNWLALAGKLFPKVLAMKNAYKVFYMDVDQLDVLPFLQKLTNKEELKKAFFEFLTVDPSQLRVSIENNAFMQVIKAQDIHWLYSQSDINHKLDTFQQALLSIGEDAKAAITIDPASKEIIKDVNRIFKELRRFAASSGSLYEIIKFAYRVYPHIYAVSQNYSQAFAASQIVFKQQLLTAMQQLNLVCREIMINMDKFKINAFLTDNGNSEIGNYQFLAGWSINEVFKALNTFVSNMGYQFKVEETYPYSLQLLKERKTLNLVVPGMLPSQRILALQNVLEAKQQEQALLDSIEKERIAKQKFAEIALLIDQRIGQLEKERGAWFNLSNTKQLKINLLTRLKSLVRNNTVEDALKLMEPGLNEHTRPYIYYLFEGRTANTLHKIQQIQCTPLGLVRMCDQEIIRLTRECSSWFFFKNKNEVQKSITNLQQLKAILAQPGYRINDALTELNGINPAGYKQLMATQAKLIAAISAIDPLIPNFQIGKTTIEVLDEPSNQVEIQQEDLLGRLDAEIFYWKKERYKPPAWFWSNTARAERYITLLSALKSNLAANVARPVDDFLKSLPSKDQRFMVNQDDGLLGDLREWQRKHQAGAHIVSKRRVV